MKQGSVKILCSIELHVTNEDGDIVPDLLLREQRKTAVEIKASRKLLKRGASARFRTATGRIHVEIVGGKYRVYQQLVARFDSDDQSELDLGEAETEAAADLIAEARKELPVLIDAMKGIASSDMVHVSQVSPDEALQSGRIEGVSASTVEYFQHLSNSSNGKKLEIETDSEQQLSIDTESPDISDPDSEERGNGIVTKWDEKGDFKALIDGTYQTFEFEDTLEQPVRRCVGSGLVYEFVWKPVKRYRTGQSRTVSCKLVEITGPLNRELPLD